MDLELQSPFMTQTGKQQARVHKSLINDVWGIGNKGWLLSARDTLASSFGSINIFKTIWWHKHPGTNIFSWQAYNHLLLVAFHTPGYQHSSRKVQTLFGDELQTTIWTVQILFTTLSLFQISNPLALNSIMLHQNLGMKVTTPWYKQKK